MIKAVARNNEERRGIETEVSIADCEGEKMAMEAITLIIQILRAVTDREPVVGIVVGKLIDDKEFWSMALECAENDDGRESIL